MRIFRGAQKRCHSHKPCYVTTLVIAEQLYGLSILSSATSAIRKEVHIIAFSVRLNQDVLSLRLLSASTNPCVVKSQ